VTVYLVGAGPGDPGLLTLRGAEVLRRADVVFYDRLSSAALLDLAPPSAERISVGKTPRGPSTPQEEINRLLVEHGRAGREVVRLKGGDVFVFARGGEEAAALRDAGVPYEIVPGVSSAIAAPAYAGVPVTTRGVATSFTVVTGHEDPWAATETDWEAVARVGGTIVVLMGVATRAEIAARLLAGGLAADTPVLAVWNGTRPNQGSLRTTLAGLGEAPVQTSATIVIGAVAALDLGWFERRPLFGRRIAVTRAREQASELRTRLEQLGAEVVEVPAIAVAPVDPAEVDLATPLATADWIAFTSANAVAAVAAQVRDARAFPSSGRVAAIGPGTAAALAAFGVVADLVPERNVAEGLVDAFPSAAAGGGLVYLPQAEDARPVLADGLRAKGWDVETRTAYRTVAAPLDERQRARLGEADAVTFTSSSTVTNLAAAAGAGRLPPVVVSIGPVTSATARRLGIDVTAEADPHTIDGLVAALVASLGT
jgi:uroporphyrinogen III methyltransferase/synthase